MTEWVTYGRFSGWVHWGTIPPETLRGDTLWHKCLRVACAAEGGKVDMVQCYDPGIMTAGPLGATARFHFLQRLMGKALEHDRRFIEVVDEVLYNDSEAMILPASKSPTGYALYTFAKPFEPALEESTIREVFLAGSDGVGWSKRQRERSRLWVDALVRLMQDDTFLRPIVDDSVWMLQRFLTPAATMLLGRVADEVKPRLTAAFLAFAVNHPVGAAKLLSVVTAAPSVVPVDRLLLLAEQRAYQTPATFPQRVKAIRKALAVEFA